MPDTPARHRRFGTFRLDTQARQLRAGDGAVVPLTAKAFDTLCCLLDRHDRVVGKDELLAVVWPGRVVEENNLTQAISALRRALGNDSRWIVTVPGRGYRFVGDVEEGDDGAAAGQAPASATGMHPPAWAMDRHRAVALGALLFMLALFAVSAWRMRDSVKPSLPASRQTLAVLPFRSLSPGPQDEMLELGLAETLITRLSGSTPLRVRSLTSSARFAGTRQDPLAAGRQLGAAYVIAGTTQREGGQVRVNARLLAVEDGRAVWSGTFDERLERAFTLQDGIAAAVASALAFELRAVPAGGRSPCDGANAEAYRAYLGGRYQLTRPSAPRMRQGIAAFRRAIDLDPACARAYAGMAYAYRALVVTGDEEPRKYFPLAQAAVKQALAIDPDLAEAYASQGFIRFLYDWDWAGAEASLRRAIALNPSLADAHLAYAHLLSNLGRKEEAVAQARQAVALDPLSPLVQTLAANFMRIAGHDREAQRGWERALELEPDFWTALLSRSGTKMARGDHAGAIADLRRASQLSAGNSQALAALAMAHVAAGDREAAMQILRDMEARGRAGYVPSSSLAAVRNALGDSAGALDLLELAYQQRDIRLAYLRVDARWHNLRPQPRFQALLQRMQLATRRNAPAPAASGVAQAYAGGAPGRAAQPPAASRDRPGAGTDSAESTSSSGRSMP